MTSGIRIGVVTVALVLAAPGAPSVANLDAVVRTGSSPRGGEQRRA